MQKLFYSFLMAIIFFGNTYAQETIPAKPEDISPLLIGETVPNVNLKTIDKGTESLRKKVAEKNTILIFFRGSWCPFCSKQLGDLQAVESDLIQAGYQLIAISPESPQNIKENIEKNKLAYTLYSDDDMAVSKAFGIAFEAPQIYGSIVSKASDKVNTNLLPVPSVFILNKEGVIKFEYINPNFKERLSGKMLLAIAKSLNEEK